MSALLMVLLKRLTVPPFIIVSIKQAFFSVSLNSRAAVAVAMTPRCSVLTSMLEAEEVPGDR